MIRGLYIPIPFGAVHTALIAKMLVSSFLSHLFTKRLHRGQAGINDLSQPARKKIGDNTWPRGDRNFIFSCFA